MIKRKKVGQIIFIGVLFTLSVGAIGFSSWIGSEELTVNSDVSEIGVNVGTLGDFRDCITLDDSKDNGGYYPLLYTASGFINSNSSSSSAPTGTTTGELLFYIKMNLANTKAKLKTDDIYLYATLKLGGSNGDTALFSSPSVILNYVNNDLTTSASVINSTTWYSQHLLSNFSVLNGENGEIYLTLTYKFNSISNARYMNIYNYLSNESNNAHFILELSLGESNE